MNGSLWFSTRAHAYDLSGPSGFRLMDVETHEPGEPHRKGLDLLRKGALSALDRGDVGQARQLIAEAITLDASTQYAESWTQLRVVTAWPDAWLIAAVRRDPPDSASLDALVGRYWKMLFGRCRMLTPDREAASDLAQEAWLRVLRSRRALNPDGNFPAYIVTIATNLWRDRYRSERRAGGMAEDRMASLEGSIANRQGETMALVDVLADPRTLPAEEQVLLKMDMDKALGRLTPRLRDVLTARFLEGESAAEIGRRYGRTEQTISGWVRDAVRDMKIYLGESHHLDEHLEKR